MSDDNALKPWKGYRTQVGKPMLPTRPRLLELNEHKLDWVIENQVEDWVFLRKGYNEALTPGETSDLEVKYDNFEFTFLGADIWAKRKPTEPEPETVIHEICKPCVFYGHHGISQSHCVCGGEWLFADNRCAAKPVELDASSIVLLVT